MIRDIKQEDLGFTWPENSKPVLLDGFAWAEGELVVAAFQRAPFGRGHGGGPGGCRRRAQPAKQWAIPRKSGRAA